MKLNQERNILIVSHTDSPRCHHYLTDGVTARGGLLQGYVIKSEDSAEKTNLTSDLKQSFVKEQLHRYTAGFLTTEAGIGCCSIYADENLSSRLHVWCVVECSILNGCNPAGCGTDFGFSFPA